MTTFLGPLTPDQKHFILTNRIYTDRIARRLFLSTGRTVKGIRAQDAWTRADQIAARYERPQEAAVRVAEREKRQRDQIVVLAEAVQVAWFGAAVAAAYAPLMTPASHADAIRDGLKNREELTR